MKKLLVLCFLICVACLLVGAAFAGDMKSETVNGWVSDSKCGAKGANAGGADSTKNCLEGGASKGVVTDQDQKILNVDNPDALKDHIGHHIAVTGHVEGDKIHVESAKAL